MLASFFRAASLAAIFILASSLTGCQSPSRDDVVLAEEGSPDLVFYGFSREEVEKGIVVFTAKAQKAEYFEGNGLLVIHGVEFRDMGADGRGPVATGQADKVVYHEDTGNAEFSGFVTLHSIAEEARFETDSLVYNASTQTIEGPMANAVIVRIGSDLILKGSGLFADISAKAFSFRNGVSGTITTGKTGSDTVREGE
jgi:LPS export ABC transporter protein LptC